MRALVVAASLSLALPACIELDEELVPAEPTPDPSDEPVGSDPQPDGLAIDPDTAPRCSVLLLVIGTPRATDVVDVRVVGPAELPVLTFTTRAEQVLATVQIPDDAPEARYDVLLDLADGDRLVEERGFEVAGDAC